MANSRYEAQIACRISISDKSYIDSKEDSSEWIRQAIREKRIKEQAKR